MKRSQLIWGVVLLALAAVAYAMGATEFVAVGKPTMTIYLPGALALGGLVQLWRGFRTAIASE
jgi:hypothetical protein